jgi:hypothetical protein
MEAGVAARPRQAVEPVELGSPSISVDLLPREEVLTPEDLYTLLRLERETRWLEKNIRRIPGRFKVGRFWRFRKADIEMQVLRTGQVLLPKRSN